MTDRSEWWQHFYSPLLLDRTTSFVGRERELERLDDFFAQGGKVASIVGEAGSGKTSMALRFAETSQQRFPGGSFRLDPGPPTPAFAKLIGRFPVPEEPFSVLIDEADRLDDAFLNDQLRRVIHTFPQARVLIIGRRSFKVSAVGLEVTLGPLSLAETKALLASLDVSKQVASDLFSLLQGHALGSAIAADAIRSGAFSPSELLDALQPFDQPGIRDAAGKPMTEQRAEYHLLVRDLSAVSDSLLKELADNPRLLYELPPRRFEEVVAELLRRQGYEVELTPVSHDGGKDIYAARRDAVGSFLYLVECKRFNADHPVGVGLVRQLHGTVQAERASAGILVTTSYFTRDALRFQNQIEYQMSLQDYIAIQRWLKHTTAGGWDG